MLWQVPVTIATSKNLTALQFVLDKQTTTVTVEGVGPDDWILVCYMYVLTHPHSPLHPLTHSHAYVHTHIT